MSQNQRQHFRIIYRDKYPLLVCRTGQYTILDISERGVRFLVKADQDRFEIGKVLEAKIILPEKRGEVTIKGQVQRVHINEVVLALDEKAQIPLRIIMDEQRALIKKGKLSAS